MIRLSGSQTNLRTTVVFFKRKLEMHVQQCDISFYPVPILYGGIHPFGGLAPVCQPTNRAHRFVYLVFGDFQPGFGQIKNLPLFGKYCFFACKCMPTTATYRITIVLSGLLTWFNVRPLCPVWPPCFSFPVLGKAGFFW